MATQPMQIAAANEAEQKQATKLYRMLVHDGTAALIGPANEKISLAPAIFRALMKVLENMQEGKAVAVMPYLGEMSTQAAADYLGMSRQFLVRELESGKMPFHKTGAHRRVYLKDVLEYKARRDQARRSAIDRMARKAEELGVYDSFVKPEEK